MEANSQQILQILLRHFSVHNSNEKMVEHLMEFDDLKEKHLVEAFRAVDKKFFVPEKFHSDAYGMRPFIIFEEDDPELQNQFKEFQRKKLLRRQKRRQRALKFQRRLQRLAATFNPNNVTTTLDYSDQSNTSSVSSNPTTTSSATTTGSSSNSDNLENAENISESNDPDTTSSPHQAYQSQQDPGQNDNLYSPVNDPFAPSPMPTSVNTTHSPFSNDVNNNNNNNSDHGSDNPSTSTQVPLRQTITITLNTNTDSDEESDDNDDDDDDDDNDDDDDEQRELTRISAPNMYVRFMKALDLKPGQQVLDVGCGSGYSTALIAYVIGKSGVIHAIDVNHKIISFTKRSIQRCFTNIPLECQVVYDIHNCFLPFTTRKWDRLYDRILVGADCTSKSKLLDLGHFLKIGGVMVAPHHDRILKITKLSYKKPLEDQVTDEQNDSDQNTEKEEIFENEKTGERYHVDTILDGVAFAPLKDPTKFELEKISVMKSSLFYQSVTMKRSKLFKRDVRIICDMHDWNESNN